MANALTVTGKYLGAGKIEEVGAKNYQKRRFYVDITTNPDYPNTPEIWLKGEKNVGSVDSLKQGDEVTVHLNIEGRKYTSKATGKTGVINEISAWKIEAVENYTPLVSKPQRSAPVPVTDFADDSSDLPF